MIDIQNTILGKIVDRKHEELAARLKQRSLHDVEQWAKEATPVRGFANALQHKRPAVIAEIKKASPSKGIIRADFNPAEIAQQYEQAGAACLSILTDVDFFQGADENIVIARNHCALPALRKDFLVDPYNVVEARALHADCILLIVAALTDEKLLELYQLAQALGMDVLVEVHEMDEAEKALDVGAKIIGVNSRNLKTLEVSEKTFEKILPALPAQILKVAESGISNRQQVALVEQLGAKAVLVGESLVRAGNPVHTIKELLNR